MKITTCLTIAFTCTAYLLKAQDEGPLPWQQRDRKNMKPLPYEYQREADVFWSKKIWRVIDVRQKMNKPFAYPQMSLVQILHEAAKRGDIKAYDASVTNGDQFKKQLTLAEVAAIGVRNDSMLQVNLNNPDQEEYVPVHNDLSWDRITKYRVQEIWFFDTHTSSMQVRIIGIAPVMEDYDAQGNYRGDMTMYWLYYPDLRNLLMKHEVFNRANDSQRMSWDDLFESRMFESYIYKESNVYDRNIQEYATGVDAQLESERIKQKIFETEHDVWEY